MSSYYRIGRSADNSFKKVCLSFISLIDYLNVSVIYAPMDKYALDELRTILFSDFNTEYVKIAAREITDYYRYSYRETYEGNRIDLDPESLYNLDEIFHRIINIAEYIDGLSKTIVYYLSLIGFLLCFYNQIERSEEKKD